MKCSASTQGLSPLSGLDVAGIRKATGLNQAAFWRRIGVTQSGGSRYETNPRIPKPVRLLIEIAYGEKPADAVKRLRVGELSSS